MRNMRKLFGSGTGRDQSRASSFPVNRFNPPPPTYSVSPSRQIEDAAVSPHSPVSAADKSSQEPAVPRQRLARLNPPASATPPACMSSKMEYATDDENPFGCRSIQEAAVPAHSDACLWFEISAQPTCLPLWIPYPIELVAPGGLRSIQLAEVPYQIEA